jgi:acetoin utilization protein AcuA
MSVWEKEFVVEGPVEGEYLLSLPMNAGLNNFRPFAVQQKALAGICGNNGGRVYIALARGEIVGYVTFHRPDAYSRWARHSRLLELGGVEVSPGWRGKGVGSGLLKHIFSDDCWEDYIVISTEYFRHWDTAGSGLGIWEYRRMLDGFFGRAGFMPVSTNDPDILEHPANVLMARVGSRVGWDAVMDFEEIATGRL